MTKDFLHIIKSYELNIGRKLKEFKVENWAFICQHIDLSEPFMRIHQARLNWLNISRYQQLSQKFIDRYEYKLDIKVIIKFQQVSEPFMLKYKNEVDWGYVFKAKQLTTKTLALLIAHKFYNDETRALFLTQLKNAK